MSLVTLAFFLVLFLDTIWRSDDVVRASRETSSIHIFTPCATPSQRFVAAQEVSKGCIRAVLPRSSIAGVHFDTR